MQLWGNAKNVRGARAVDIAAGLGDQVTIAGLSAGGVVAAWAAQHRRDVHRAVLIAPSLGVRSPVTTS